MKCFLHIGTEKTATKTIQSFLNLNREGLCERGYLYPKSVGCTNQYSLAVSAYNLTARDDLTMTHNLYTDQELSNYQDYVIEMLGEELKMKKSQKVIFSSEHLQSRLTTLDEIERLKNILNKLGFDEISVIVYLRNPSELANSLYSTQIKCGLTAISPPFPDDGYYSNICNHKYTLEKFGRIFGESALKPRIFCRTEWKNGSIIDDFIDVLSLPDFDSYTVPGNKNKALSITGVELLRRLNDKVPSFIDNKPNPLRSHLVSCFESYFTNGEKYVMPKDLWQQYDDAFRESNEWVRTHFFPNKQLLFTATHPNECKTNMSSCELDWIADMIYTALMYKHGQEPEGSPAN